MVEKLISGEQNMHEGRPKRMQAATVEVPAPEAGTSLDQMRTIRGEDPAKVTKIIIEQAVGLLAMSTPRATVAQRTDDDDDDAWMKRKVNLLLSYTAGVGSRRRRYHITLGLIHDLGGTLEASYIVAYSTVTTYCVY